jgi:hypothetical protein
MKLIKLNRALVQLRLSGMVAVLETRLLQAQSDTEIAAAPQPVRDSFDTELLRPPPPICRRTSPNQSTKLK